MYSLFHKYSDIKNGVFGTYTLNLNGKSRIGAAFFSLIFMLAGQQAISQTINIPTGSYIINMGVVPQTVGNGLKPYGMVYDLIKNYGVTVIWSINPSKSKDGIDFTHNGVDYKGGTFIIPAEFRNTTVNARITFWQGQGVVGATTVSPITVPLFNTYNLKTTPRWTLDKQNGSIATGYFVNAGIPASAHGGSSSSGWKDPAELDCCDDLFVMPHADPIWATHNRLLSWNDALASGGCKGAVWAACHAVSALENMVNPSNRSQQTNFLTQKDPAWTGTSGNYTLSNALVLWGSHGDGTIPYTFNASLGADPVGQYMGVIDGALTNGSEQIYMPRQGIVSNPLTYNAAAVARWNPSAKVLVYDPTQPDVTNPNTTTLQNIAAGVVYGRAFENNNRGYVMYEAGHSHNKAFLPPNIAAQRAFFNFGFLVANDKSVAVDISSVPSVVTSGQPTPLSITFNPSGTYTVTWNASCGGSFSPNGTTITGTSYNTTFTPPIVSVPTTCNVNITIVDPCGRQTNASKTIVVQPCNLTFNNTVTPVSCNGLSDGNITMGITGSSGPFTWNWTRTSPAGSGSGSGLQLTNLSTGTYTVTVSDASGCTGTFTTLVSQPAVLSVTPTVSNYLCFGQTGSINLTVTGGNPGFTFDWADLPGTMDPKDRVNLTAGNYSVTVTDTKGCSANLSSTVTGPLSALSVQLVSKQDVSCNGANNGTISASVSGGTPGYTILWNDGNTNLNRTNLAPGTYVLTVTDVNGCQALLVETITEPAPLILTHVKTNPTCPPGSNPPVNQDGSIDLTVAGGTPGYTYTWSTLDGSGLINGNEDQSGLTAGTYQVIVTDVNGCNANLSITLTNTLSFPSPPAGIIKF